MNVAIIGSGGREHALSIAVSKSKKLEKLYILPGNPGTSTLGTNVKIDLNDNHSIINFCKEKFIDLVIIGPEQPLINGLADELQLNQINVFGPSQDAARLEGEKSFAKKLMKESDIPTAAFEVFNKENYNNAIKYLDTIDYPIVIKADGIAAGKGVIIAENYFEAKNAIDDCFIKTVFGNAGEKIVIEEFMTGQEASVFAITDGYDFVLLPPAQDHKRILDDDKGKNTGGMGAFAPTPFVNEKMLDIISQKIIKPTLDVMNKIGNTYQGCLYCGLMLTKNGPKVVEFNCRFGDPETQVVLPLLDGDILELFYSAASGRINKNSVWYNGGSSVCVVLSSKGYPDKYEKDKEIFGLNKKFNDNIIVYHAGTKEINKRFYTNGGRVLGVTSVLKENNLHLAKQICYEAITNLSFDGIYFRKDIGDKAIKFNKQTNPN